MVSDSKKRGRSRIFEDYENMLIMKPNSCTGRKADINYLYSMFADIYISEHFKNNIEDVEILIGKRDEKITSKNTSILSIIGRMIKQDQFPDEIIIDAVNDVCYQLRMNKRKKDIANDLQEIRKCLKQYF